MKVKKSKKIIICICVVSILLVIFAIPCSAMYSISDVEDGIIKDTYTLGIPFDLTIGGIYYSDPSVVATVNDFGSIQYNNDYDYYNGIGNKYNNDSWESYPNASYNANAKFIDNAINLYQINDGSTNYANFWKKEASARFISEVMGYSKYLSAWEFRGKDISDPTVQRSYQDRLEQIFSSSGNGSLSSSYQSCASSFMLSSDVIIDRDILLGDSSLFAKCFPDRLIIRYLCNENSVMSGGNFNDDFLRSLYFTVDSWCDVYVRDETTGNVELVPYHFSHSLLHESKLGGNFSYSAIDSWDSLYWSSYNSYFPESWWDNYIQPLDFSFDLNNFLVAYQIIDGAIAYSNFRFTITPNEVNGSIFGNSSNYYLNTYMNWSGGYPFTQITLDYDHLSAVDSSNSGYFYQDTPTYLYGDFDSYMNVHRDVVYLDESFDPVSWLGDTLSGVFDTPLFGDITLGHILLVAIGCGFVMIVLKFFVGG